MQLIAACDRLEHLPERGRPDVVPGTRELVALWPYVVVYRVSAGVVEVLRIWHGAQDRASDGRSPHACISLGLTPTGRRHGTV